MSEIKNVKELLQEELDQRISIIESSDYKPVESLNKADFIGMAVTAIICAVIIMVGIV